MPNQSATLRLGALALADEEEDLLFDEDTDAFLEQSQRRLLKQKREHPARHG